jgi:DNA (cytosine-5)-methyltransferase 1
MAIPVVDVFAGPGGLGEGFASHRAPDERQVFEVVLSVEKEAFAHRTLRLRKMLRRVGRPLADRVFGDVIDGRPPDASLGEFPEAFKKVAASALRLDLGPETGRVVTAIRDVVRQRDPWVLVGGPPCQAYSIVGRVRNRGKDSYIAEEDARQTLYIEYLQILAECEPAVFVMENVKGLLSATLNSALLFERITADLAHPSAALRREGRTAKGNPRYSLFALDHTGLRTSSSASDYVVRAEEFGVPQARHRVIIIGVREGASVMDKEFSLPASSCSIDTALEGLPRVRSGISRGNDDPVLWLETVKTMAKQPWASPLKLELREHMQRSSENASLPRHGRGAEALCNQLGERVFNHSTRAHIPGDLDRYFFASNYASLYKRSPSLESFPPALLPAHKNVDLALRSGMFNDRFRVQVSGRPSTTITSHIAKDGHYYIHSDPTQCRSLTVREAARLQTFPDDYVFCGPRTSQYWQVGNAVPPRLAEKIASAVSALLG